MADTCIVCLGDMRENAKISTFLHPVKTLCSDEVSSEEDTKRPLVSPLEKRLDVDYIAHLLPCGHNLHDECLRPWVERANSCPICRQNFNKVDLLTHIGGLVVSSYKVEDRRQVADIDPSMIIDEDILDHIPCPECESFESENLMVLCDRCDVGWHTFCVGLHHVPEGNWYCQYCLPILAAESASRHTRGPGRLVRTQAQRLHARQEDLSWAQVWQSVHDSTGLDLDFPDLDFPHNTSRPSRGRRSGQHATGTRGNNSRFWEERIPVAERQGGANPFSVAASAIFRDRPSRPRPERPEPESLEEQMAWNAFEKARDIEADSTSRSRKRKSATNSPSDAELLRKRKKRKSATTSPTEYMPPPRVDRPLKRPQTRRVKKLQEPTDDMAGDSSTPRTLHPGTSIDRQPRENGSGPTFFQSLLKEVESSVASEGRPGKSHTSLTLANYPSDYSSPRCLSPGASPTGSNHPSPRVLSTTPPPYISGRPGSPVPLTSKVEPIYAPPEFSSERSPPLESSLARPQSRSSFPIAVDVHLSRSIQQEAPDSSRSRSNEASPTRMNVPQWKEDILKLVKEVLREPYRNNEISKEEYTEINMTVSRQLYEIVGDSGKLAEEAVERCKRIATKWVSASIATLHMATKP